MKTLQCSVFVFVRWEATSWMGNDGTEPFLILGWGTSVLTNVV